MTIDYSKFKHISFDLWLTLIKSNPEFKIQRNYLFKEFFFIKEPIEKVSEIVRYYDLLCNHLNEKTGLNIDTFEIYCLILNELKVELDKFQLLDLMKFYHETELLFLKYPPKLIDPKIQSLFKQISDEGKSINILSNTGFIKGNTIKNFLISYDLDKFFAFQIYSDETRISKPNYQMFQLVYNEILKFKTIDKIEILHVGDNRIADYNGALAFGFSALLIN